MSKVKDNGPLKFSKPLVVYSDTYDSDCYSFEDVLGSMDISYIWRFL